MNDMDNRKLGKKYEDTATKYLIENGYKIICTNFFAKIGEIDIVAKDKATLCFIEVKYRKSGSLSAALEAVDKNKQNKIINASKYYLLKNNIDEYNTDCRFDVVSIDGNDIELIKNAFP